MPFSPGGLGDPAVWGVTTGWRPLRGGAAEKFVIPPIRSVRSRGDGIAQHASPRICGSASGPALGRFVCWIGASSGWSRLGGRPSEQGVNFGTLGRDRSRVGAGPGIGANTHGTSSFPCLALGLARRRFGACRIFLPHWSPTRWSSPYGRVAEGPWEKRHREPLEQGPPFRRPPYSPPLSHR